MSASRQGSWRRPRFSHWLAQFLSVSMARNVIRGRSRPYGTPAGTGLEACCFALRTPVDLGMVPGVNDCQLFLLVRP
jgi:hypothetical protein